MSEAARLPLAGLRVIEMGVVIAAPFCASVLADLGAELIKVEPPKDGDPFRTMGPRVKGAPLWWGVASRNKRCVTMDLKSAVDKRRFEILAASADVFIENNRPGALDRLGLGYERLAQLNPRLIMVSISGFGQTGPDAQRPGFGKIAEAMSGQVAITGRPDAMPYHIGFSLADTSAGLTGVFAIAMLLYLRDVAGRARGAQARGAHVDIALYEPLMRMQECQFALRERTGSGPLRQASNDPFSWGVASGENAAIACHRCADGAWLAVMTDENPPDDLAACVAGLTVDAALAALAARGIKAARVHDGLSLAADAYFRARHDVEAYRHEALGAFTVPGFVPRGRGSDGLNVFRSPGLGEDNDWLAGQIPGV
jgi:succinyl-CoA---D-citramalate CoA-transferase